MLIHLFTYTYIFIYKNRLNYFILNRLFSCCFAFYKFVAIGRKYLSTLCHSYFSGPQLPFFSHNEISSNISKLSFIIIVFVSSNASNAFFKPRFLKIWVIIYLVTFLSLILPLNINIVRKKSWIHCTESFKSSKRRISIKWKITIKTFFFFSLCFRIFLVDWNNILHY